MCSGTTNLSGIAFGLQRLEQERQQRSSTRYLRLTGNKSQFIVNLRIDIQIIQIAPGTRSIHACVQRSSHRRVQSDDYDLGRYIDRQGATIDACLVQRRRDLRLLIDSKGKQ